MDKALSDLLRISKAVGKDPALVQGGGGNTSVKTTDGKYMYIKASGTALKDMNERTGFRRLRLDKVLETVEDKRLAKLPAQTREPEIANRLLLACDGKMAGDIRPSIETPLHAVLGKYVIHLHPVAVLAFVCAKNGRVGIERIFKTADFTAVWVPYTESGIMLAKKITKLAENYRSRPGKKPVVFFLQKHGIFVSADTPKAALRLVRAVIKRCTAKLKFPKAVRTAKVNPAIIQEIKLSIRRAFYEATGQYNAIHYFYNDTIAAFCRNSNAGKMFESGTFSAGELAYADGPAVWVERPDSKKIAGQMFLRMKKYARPPSAFIVKGTGLFVTGERKHAETVREITEASFIVRINAVPMGGIVCLSKSERDFVNQGEAAPNRKNAASVSELQGRIAVVTGAGSGLGRSVALGLAKAGAMVALVDIDKKAAEEAAQQIRNAKYEIRNPNTIAVQCDVTNETSIDNAFAAVLDKWGGLDILVNAAGIAPPYGLIDMPADKWRKALDVNLSGYFLMAKAAAGILIKQGIDGSIINLSSKSGLEPSKNNTAYTTTKAGELAMARGWALELGEYGIRVNCVAAGNVFEGSKIWNPAYIRQCAKKYGIKPEQVIPYYVNKTSLKREIKGQDIADAVVFLCSDRARTITGQTLVADSGQVMVR